MEQNFKSDHFDVKGKDDDGQLIVARGNGIRNLKD